jgi:hypothetical protein
MRESHTTTGQQLSIVQTLSLGFKVLISEIHWQILRGLRSWEIRQMRSRLAKEYERLGKLLETQAGGAADGDRQAELDLCRKQIDFLTREVDHLQTQLWKLRRDIIARRRTKWGV